MKNQILITITLFLIQVCNAQTDTIDYFGQTPPGNSAIVFSPDFISTNDRFVQNSSFSPDGLEFSFSVTNSNWSHFEVRYTKYVDSEWTDPIFPEFLDEFTICWGMCFSPDSNRFYMLGVDEGESFGSMWYSERDGDSWNPPQKLPAPVNASQGVGEPSVSCKNTLFFAKSGGMFYSEFQEGNYSEIRLLKNPVNTNRSDDIDPFISPNEDYLIFSSNRPGVYGLFDLYISYKKEDGMWTNPKNLGSKINTEEWECVPSVTPDGKYLLFTRREDWQTTNPSKLYWVSSLFIDSLKLINYSPYTLNRIPNQIDTIGNLYSYTVPDSIFFDDDGFETLAFTALLSDGSDLPDSLTFNSETNTISGRLKEAGTYNIKITATDTAGADVSDDFVLHIEDPALVTDINTNVLKVYPIPAHGSLTIHFENTSFNKCDYYLMDEMGKTIKQGILNSTFEIDVSAMDNGLYFLRIVTDYYDTIQKIIIE